MTLKLAAFGSDHCDTVRVIRLVEIRGFSMARPDDGVGVAGWRGKSAAEDANCAEG